MQQTKIVKVFWASSITELRDERDIYIYQIKRTKNK